MLLFTNDVTIFLNWRQNFPPTSGIKAFIFVAWIFGNFFHFCIIQAVMHSRLIHNLLELVRFRPLIQPSVTFYSREALKTRTVPSFLGLVQPRSFSSSEPSSKWGSKSKKDKRKIPLHLSTDMSLSPESEALLAPFRARVKEQVRLKHLVGFKLKLSTFSFWDSNNTE